MLLTEILWSAILNENIKDLPWIVAGDLNSSVTFDTMWQEGPRGNQEIQDRMSALGFTECLRFSLCGTILLRLDLTAKNTAAGLKEWVVNGGTLIAEAFPGYFEGAECSAHHQPPSCWDSVHLACRKILQTIYSKCY
jgi:hypothetical protein